MPLKDVRYRWKTYPSGKKVRLAFKKGTNRIVEAKSASGEVHTPADFARDRRERAQGRRATQLKARRR